MGSEFFFEGKKYISASRASKIIGYNSDYIGQLCRKGSLQCRMVGRTWFVDEESLVNHKISAGNSQRGRIPIYDKNTKSSEGAKSMLSPAHPRSGTRLTSPVVSVVAAEDEQLRESLKALPFRSVNLKHSDFIDDKAARKEANIFLRHIAIGTTIVILAVAMSANLIFPGGNGDLDLAVQSGDEGVETIGNKFENKFTELLFRARTYKQETGDSLVYSANVFQSAGTIIGEKTSLVIRSVNDGLSLAGNFFRNMTNNARLIVSNSGWVGDRTDDSDGDSGVVVLPSAGDEDINGRVREYVLESFSDETEIVPDKSGNSGLIRPVFKEKSEQEYLYVVVPVKDSQIEDGRIGDDGD